jgi:uncharacterized membrane protein YbaN (DUF454 family)
MEPFMKYLLLGTGFICIGLGTLGIFLPLLPTTPFLLAASFCFLKSSRRAHTWLTSHRLFGRFIRDFTRYRIIPLRAKVISVLLLAGSLTATSIFMINSLVMRIVLAVIGISVTVYILHFPSSRDVNTE